MDKKKTIEEMVNEFEDEMTWEIAIYIVTARIVRNLFPQFTIAQCFSYMDSPVFMSIVETALLDAQAKDLERMLTDV